MEYLRVDRLCPLITSADGSRVLMWYVDAPWGAKKASPIPSCEGGASGIIFVLIS